MDLARIHEFHPLLNERRLTFSAYPPFEGSTALSPCVDSAQYHTELVTSKYQFVAYFAFHWIIWIKRYGYDLGCNTGLRKVHDKADGSHVMLTGRMPVFAY